MNGFLIDTNVLPEYNRRGGPDAGVRRRLETTARELQYVSVITPAEIQKGIELLPAAGAYAPPTIMSPIAGFVCAGHLEAGLAMLPASSHTPLLRGMGCIIAPRSQVRDGAWIANLRLGVRQLQNRSGVHSRQFILIMNIFTVSYRRRVVGARLACAIILRVMIATNHGVET